MTSGDPPKKARPWLKPLSYVLAGGAVLTAGSAWFAHSSIMRGVYLRIIASTVKDSTGLDFDAGDMSFSVLKSRVRLHYPSLDTDFFKADEIELVVSPISLLGDSPHIKRLVVVNPVSNISARRLEKIKLKQSDGPAANWKLDVLEISNGKIFIKEPEWGLPQAEVTFKTRAIGSGPKALKIETDCSKIFIVNKSMSLRGSANIHMDVKADIIELRQMSFDNEFLKLKATGTFNGENNIIVCETNGSILSQNLPEVFGANFSGFNGQADFRASLSGEADNLEWDLQVNAKRITTPYQSLDNITLEVQGVASDINLKQLSVRSPEGASISAYGEMKETEYELILDGRAVPLKALSGIIKMPFFESVSADIQGFFSSKVPVWDTDALSQSKIDLSAIFNRNGEPAGDLTIIAEKNALQIKSFNIDIPELKASAIGSFGYKTRNIAGNPDFGITSIALTGEVVTTAEQVANSLDKWKIVDRLPISGKTSASAHVTWSQSKDLQLSGYLKLENPVYYGATADILTTGVKIDSERLFLDNIRLNSKEAEATGNLWLTWANVPQGGDQISMRFELLNLPVSEGLDAAISDPKILEDMAAEGRVNGWAALKGPYDSMTLSGEARLHDASVYGVSIPAFSGSIEMNLNESNIHFIVPEFRLADCSENLDSLSGPLGLKGNLDIDLTAETWTGRIIGAVDSHALGMTNAPRLSAQINAALSGPYAADYGPIALPEGSISLSEGMIAFGDSKLEGLLGNINVEDGKIHGTIYFDDFQDSRNPLMELNARKGVRNDRNNLTWQLQVAFSQETAQTKILAQTLTDGVLEDINLGLHASGRFNDRGLFWRADVNKFGCRISGLEFGQQSFGAIEGNLDDINLALSLESQTSDEDMSKKVSWFRINGTIPLNNAKITDLGLVGVADLEQTRRILAGVFRKRPDEFLAGFTPEGVGLADMKLSGSYDALGLDGVLQVRNGRLRPQDNFPYGIENLNVDLRCEGRRVALENLRGRMARGLLTANGSAVWNNNGLESYEVRAALNDFHYHFIPDGFRLSGSLDALFHNLPYGKSEIKGALKASDISYVTEIDLKKIILNNSVLNIPSLKNIELDDPMDAINLDLDVELTQPWSFDTNLMKFKGLPANNFKILGTLANPGLRGRMEFIPGGRITNILPAGDVIIEKGSIDFPDPSVFNPVLDIQGQIDIVPFRVHLNIQGPLDTLNMAPTSTPTLRQDEVISLLLNPAIAPTIGNSAFSGSLSSSATASGGLADTAGGLITNLFLTSIQEQFRRALGLDRVSVAWRTGISGTSETDVVIGKNLNLGERAIPVIGSYKTSGDIVTIGGQIEWRFGNLVIHIGASGSRSVRVTPSGEIRYQWSSW